jgi:hypothetical protein
MNCLPAEASAKVGEPIFLSTFNLYPITFNPMISPMSIFEKLSPLQQKIITASLCVIGIPTIAYGMIKKNNPVFLIGIVFVIAGYLLIRKKLKESIQKKL